MARPTAIELNGVALDLDHRKPVALLPGRHRSVAHAHALAALLWPEYENAAHMPAQQFVLSAMR
ncbi:MAG: hypothetical protein U0350_33455 [Caldilineaceae bacterium]